MSGRGDGDAAAPAALVSPKASKGQRKRELIRKVAYQCFRDQGYVAATVDAICDAAGISKGSFYWHYDSKQAVFVDILDTWSREVMDQLYEQFEDAVVDADYRTAVTAALQRELHRGRAIVPLWLEFAAQARREPQVQEALGRFFARARAAIVEVLRPALEGRCDEEELRGVAAAIFGGFVGLLVQDLTDPARVDADGAVASFMRVVERSAGGR